MTEYMRSRAFFKKNRDAEKKQEHPIIVCWKLITPNNLGSILRLADNMACEKVLFVDENPNFKDRNIKKTAQTQLNWADVDLTSRLDQLKKLTQMNDSIAQDVKSIKKGVQLIVAIMLVQLIVVGLYIILVAVPVINKM